MTVISQRIPSIVGGVSQQPDALKLPNQLRVCDDFLPDPTFGLAKRPGLKAINTLSNAATDGAWFQTVRDDEERYVIQVARDGNIRIWDADSGVQQTVNFPDAPSAAQYATHTKDDDIELFQINDFILLLNRTVVVTPSTGLAGGRTPYAIATINSVGYNTEYKVTLNSQIYTYQTTATTTVRLSVEDVTTGLVATINAGGIFTATAIANYLYIVKNDAAEFRVNARGGTTGTAIFASYGTVSSPAELPRQFINNATIQVLGPEGGDDYWVIFKVENGGNEGAGIWEETIKPSSTVAFNKNTLPHGIIREADGTFTYRRLNKTFADAHTSETTVNGTVVTASVLSGTKGIYAPGVSFWCTGGSGTGVRLRTVATDVDGHVTAVEVSRPGRGYTNGNTLTNEYGDTFTITQVASVTGYSDSLGLQYYIDKVVGDSETNPFPTFTNKTISGISFFKNRLVLLSGENVICSAVGDYFNFFLSTVTTVVDSDPVDISCGSLKPIDLRYAMLSDRGLALFADNAQYVLETRTESFSAATAEINQIGSYDISTSIAPVDMGPTIAFLDQGEKSCSVFELLIGNDNIRPQTAELTRTIPSYLPSYVSRMNASTAASILGIHSLREPNNLYLFRFYNVGTERQQAAWFRWKFPGEIKTFYFESDKLFAVIKPAGSSSFVLCTASLITETSAAPLSFDGTPLDVRLDMYTYNPTLVYESGTDTTKVCMPNGFGNTTHTVNVVRTDSGGAGAVWEDTLTYDAGAPTGQKYFLRIDGNQTANRFAIGYKYTSKALMPSWYVFKEDRKDTLNVPIVQRVYLDSANSGPYQVRVEALGRNEYLQTFPQISANLSNLDELPILRNAQNVVPVMAAGNQVDVTIECPYPYPTAINGLTWTGQYNNRGIRSV